MILQNLHIGQADGLKCNKTLPQLYKLDHEPFQVHPITTDQFRSTPVTYCTALVAGMLPQGMPLKERYKTFGGELGESWMVYVDEITLLSPRKNSST